MATPSDFDGNVYGPVLEEIRLDRRRRYGWHTLAQAVPMNSTYRPDPFDPCTCGDPLHGC